MKTKFAWLYLLAACAFEVLWALTIKETAGYSRLWPSIRNLALEGGSIYLLSLAVRDLPLGTAYAVWTGLGGLGAFVGGLAFLGETASPLKMAAAGLTLLGLIGMHLA